MSALTFTASKSDLSCESGSCSGHRKARYRVLICDHPAGVVCPGCKAKYEKVWENARG